MSIAVTADTTCDLSEQLKKRYHISTTPLYIIKDGKALKDNIEITTADIFAHVAAGGELCTTAAVSEADYYAFFDKKLKTCDGLVHVTISADMSSCYQNACNAARHFTNVRVVDSRNLSMGMGLVVLEGAKRALDGGSLEEVARTMNDLTGRIDATFVIDKLDYLRKGGRCSAVMALGANILNIKPCIAVKNGKMLVEKKYRGKFEKVLTTYVEERLKGDTSILPHDLVVVHTDVAPETCLAIREQAKAYQPFDNVMDAVAGCTIACHCGPATLGLMYVHR